MTITALRTEMSTETAAPNTILPPLPAKVAWAWPIRTNLTAILQQIFYRLLAFLLQQGMSLRLRWGKFKDALFYETILLLLQPNPVVLILMWPGWIVVLLVVVWRWWAGAGDAV
ncbi:hypothetical protein C7212DRAFT_338913 [Tuber magnatum]|uniref:Uncharacterized protein n=1 Tax=Tuber magnatum TaxID=42249 RepID=A0A317SD77_9PEZI|nr:hypothetical protein C7212DRAFT_338913 [Tuber magnatum]